MHQNRPVIESNKKTAMIVLFFFSIIVLSAALSIGLYLFFEMISRDAPVPQQTP